MDSNMYDELIPEKLRKNFFQAMYASENAFF